tara:strand:- start:10 stop:381 length:372 start_codon:yes stop_codon:yes gene_type:complete
MSTQNLDQKEDPSHFKNHVIGIAYPALLSFLILDWEYKRENYFYFYFRPFQIMLEKMHSILVIPVSLIVGLLVFSMFTFFLNKKHGFKVNLKQTILTGIILVFYLLLITLEIDTKAGSFFHPV